MFTRLSDWFPLVYAFKILTGSFEVYPKEEFEPLFSMVKLRQRFHNARSSNCAWACATMRLSSALYFILQSRYWDSPRFTQRSVLSLLSKPVVLLSMFITSK